MTHRGDAKRVLVTGGGTGIGAAISSAFLESGARVVIGHSTQENANRGVSALRAAGARADKVYGVGADLSTPAGCRDLADRSVGVLGGVDVLVNNAGLVGRPVRAAFDETADELLDRVIDVNLKAPFRLSRNLSPYLGAGGVIVNIGSTAGFCALDRASAYCISKGGVEMLTKAMALELGRRRIRVVGIAPGDIESPGDVAVPAPTSSTPGPTQHASVLDRQGRAAEVAAAVLFVSSDAASYITGTTIVVDGGLLAA